MMLQKKRWRQISHFQQLSKGQYTFPNHRHQASLTVSDIEKAGNKQDARKAPGHFPPFRLNQLSHSYFGRGE